MIKNVHLCSFNCDIEINKKYLMWYEFDIWSVYYRMKRKCTAWQECLSRRFTGREMLTLTCDFLQDFLLMFLHHVATISLITFSYVNNMARVGTLVMCLHDAADVLLEVTSCSIRGITSLRWSKLQQHEFISKGRLKLQILIVML